MATEPITIFGTLLFKRGTKADLAAMEEIIQSGEPVYEIDTGRIKIGDGKTKYVDLQYIGGGGGDEEIDALIDKVNNFLNGADISQEAIDTLIEIQTQFNNSETKVTDVIKEIATLKATDTELSNLISDLKATQTTHSQKLIDAEKDRALIREQYANADDILSTTCDAENTAIRAEFAAADLGITTNLNNEITRATSAEAQVLSEAKAYANEIKANLLGEGVLNETYDTLKEISDWIAAEGIDTTELASAIATETANREAENAKLNSLIEENVTSLSNKIDATDKKHQEDIIATNNTITALGNELRGVDTNINARIDEVVATYPGYVQEQDQALATQLRSEMEVHHNNILTSVSQVDADLRLYIDQQIGEIENGAY